MAVGLNDLNRGFQMATSCCVVTVHGIGFQRAPDDASGTPGYADALHAHLRSELGDRLGDDPERGERGGPVYVRSECNGAPAEGLARLDPSRKLTDTGKIAHVALVYSPSEPLGSHLAETADALVRAAVAHNHYANALGTLRLLISDAWGALHEDTHGGDRSTLQPRDDLHSGHHQGRLTTLLHKHHPPATSNRAPSGTGGFGMVRALEDDIATYVARNELRERVRGFVQQALLALLDRHESSTIVINAHSQGTVLSWDVLCRLPFSNWLGGGDPRAGRIAHFVTAGSPIRKYVDMFAWGNQVGELHAVLPSGALEWSNFCDPRDPVGDPLDPPASWRPGQPWTPPQAPGDGLLVTRNPLDGTTLHAPITDIEVNNTKHSSGGGLQAHDYWNNTVEFVPALARLLSDLDARVGETVALTR